ncbi:unnamed protein product [Clonostachys rhizophaga]|uniref:NAD-dependent epimerase/dehydratase domain-containing protein n=1 Tax=Clonostachys rhizophaga TaxID=160324 RepID=A0A9N9VTA3_9HYPO|nr:unnamed protein product [Clonostachys rhizophaga]
MSDKTGLVTGASGYIALHVVGQLLEAGWTVHATVRSLQNARKVQPLHDLSAKYPGKLQLFEADLLVPGSFLPAMKGCGIVFHVASPFIMPEHTKNPQKQLIEPALQGTRNVLGSVNETESVTRVVLTSSTGAMYGDKAEVLKMENQTLQESSWSQYVSISHNAYQYSKVVAEKEAWKMAEAQDRWDLVAMCPGMVLGPSLTSGSVSGSLDLIDQLMSGHVFFGVPDLHFDFVDVRDVAAAHISAATTPTARGRYIISTSATTPLVEVSKEVRKIHKHPWLLPTWNLPNIVFRLVGPFMGLSQAWMAGNLSIAFKVDNTRGIKELEIEYRPLQQTLTDQYQAWAILKKKK